MSYYEKYIKYKNKYLQLSNKLGGAAAEESPKKKSKPTITIGDIFYVKWNMSDGTFKYYQSSVIAINKARKTFTLRYSLPEEDGSHTTETRKNSEIDKDLVLRHSTYLEKFSRYPPKRVKVGTAHQAVLPTLGTLETLTTQDKMQPLSEEQILEEAEKDIANLPPHIQEELQELARKKKILAAEILLTLKKG
jgi:hypothetical protein